MNIKQQLTNAINSLVVGDTESATTALKKAVTEKVRRMVKESAPNQHGQINWWEDNQEYFGPFDTQLAEGEVEGLPAGNYEMCVQATLQQFGKNTVGNASPVAADPDEYFGQRADYELTIEAVQIYGEQDDQAIATIEGPGAGKLVDDEISNQIEASINAAAEKAAEDDFDIPDRHDY